MARIDRFPSYEFRSDGVVVSYLKKAPRILKPIRMGEYAGLQLKRSDGHIEKAYLHRLICEAHLGPCPHGMECRHLDGNKHNNAASNLRWGTKKENESDKIAHANNPVGEKNPMAKLTEDNVREMRRHREITGQSFAKIGKHFGVSAMTAHRAITGKQWRTVK